MKKRKRYLVTIFCHTTQIEVRATGVCEAKLLAYSKWHKKYRKLIDRSATNVCELNYQD